MKYLSGSDAYRKNLKGQSKDRHVDNALVVNAEQYAKGLSSAPSNAWVNMYMDGADQAEFKTPRNISMSKDFQSLWRPQLHMIGCLVDGICDHYFMSDMDIVKDANLQVICV